MNSIKNQRLIPVENDPDYQALVKMGRQTNVFSLIFWGCFFLSSIPFVLYLLLCAIEFRMISFWWNGFLIVGTPSVFGGLAILSERVGEQIMNWKDKREAQRQTREFISRISQV